MSQRRERYLTQLEHMIRQYHATMERQLDIMDRVKVTSDKQEPHLAQVRQDTRATHLAQIALAQVSLAEKITDTMRCTETMAHSAVERELRARLFETFMRRGEMIVRAARWANSEDLLAAMESSDCLDEESLDCIELYLNWSSFLRARAWDHAQGGQGAEDLPDALRLIQLWKAQVPA
jgi:hypothetical protein